MKRIPFIFYFISFLSTTLFAQTKQRVVVGTIGVEVTDQRALNALVDEFQEALIYGGGERYEVRNGQDEFDNFIKDEYAIQSTGYIADSQLASIGNALGAQYICGIVVEYNKIDKDFYFRAKIVSVETDEVKHTARYPNEIEGDLHVEELSRFNLQKVALLLIKRLDILSKEGNEKLDSKIEQMRIQERNKIEETNKKNKEKEEQINIERKKREKKEKAYKRQESFEDFFKPDNTVEMLLGYSPGGFKFALQFDVKYVSLGIGVTTVGEQKSFPIQTSEVANGMFLDTYPAQYDLKMLSMNFALGLNFKYFGFALQPEIYFLKEDSDVWPHDPINEYVAEHYPHSLMAYTPTFFIHIPFNKHNPYSAGLAARIGYTIAPDISYNIGTSIEVGLSWPL